ncbi:hypothetical protein O0L34_g13379 [Tuta absoluta]|nr:hypothetical protein O0L34_g13379 [Tuta absoluta]
MDSDEEILTTPRRSLRRRLPVDEDPEPGCSAASTEQPPPPKRACPQENSNRSSSLDHFMFLQQQISDLRSFIANSIGNCSQSQSENSMPGTSNEDSASISSEIVDSPPAFSMDFEGFDTTVTENIKKADEARIKYLAKLQHFGSSEWSEVRYIDIQKKYIASPAFTNLELNDELLPFERKPYSLRLLDRTFGALTNMLLDQREALQSSIKTLLTWSADSNTKLTSAAVNAKVQEIFSSNSKFREVSKDILQVVCGRRAEVIEQRRNEVLSSVKDKFNRTILKRVPPTSKHLFEPKDFSEAVTKLGGGSKVFQRPYLPAEGRQAAPKRSNDPAVSFRKPGPVTNYKPQGFADRNKASSGKRFQPSTKNKQGRKDDNSTRNRRN